MLETSPFGSDQNVPPHFHKDYRIEEKDLIPNGDTIDVVPNFPAPEGTEVTYYNNGTFKRYKMVKGTWFQVGKSAWENVAQGTIDSTASLALGSLAGNTDKLYRLLLKYKFGTTGDIYLRFNASSTAKYLKAIHRAGYVGAGTVHNSANDGGTQQSEMYLQNASYKEGMIELLIFAASGVRRHVLGKHSFYTDNDNYGLEELSGIWDNTADEITSINLTAGTNFAAGTEYWLDKRIN
jgi:hypothetical protein